jgi:hypothetical protein
MKRDFRSLLAAAGLASTLAAASTLVLAQATSPFPSAPDDPSITAPSASQGRQGHRGRHHGQHADRGRHAMSPAMSQADRQARRAAMDRLSTPEERTAFREKMRSATPEQRPQLMAARRVEIEQRAQERGVTLPVMQPGGGHGGRRGEMRGERRGDMHERMHGGSRGQGTPGQVTPVPSPASPSAPAAPASM